MYSIGLTGGIGSGKSRVADMLGGLGAAIVDTDAIAHSLTAPGGQAIEPLRRVFGDRVIAADGALDRAVMRELVFDDADARRRLESILHPMITSVTRREAARARGCYLVYVVPLLVESGRWRDRVDRICVVDCDEATQVARVQARSGLTPEAIARIMSVQASRKARLAAADDVVFNGEGTSLDDLVRRVHLLHATWRLQAAHRQSMTKP